MESGNRGLQPWRKTRCGQVLLKSIHRQKLSIQDSFKVLGALCMIDTSRRHYSIEKMAVQ